MMNALSQITDSPGKPSVLIADDDAEVGEMYSRALKHSGYPRIRVVNNLDEMERALEKSRFDVVLIDLFLGQENGLDGITKVIEHDPAARIAVLSGRGTIGYAVKAIGLGAVDFIEKSEDPRLLHLRIDQIMRSRSSAARDINDHMGIIGTSTHIRHIREMINLFKDVDANVTITGESGTGKEVVAKALHYQSRRKEKPFLPINCGAIPESLLESELFGYRRGAFTDAKSNRRGAFEICTQGTLFLDEITEMKPALQVKLLRVLQEKEVSPLGCGTPIPVGTRVVVATNRDLKEEVKQGRFREDLFFRLNILRIHISPLRERREDIRPLVNHFLAKYNLKYKKNIPTPNRGTMNRMYSCPWEGNVRELQSYIERSVIMAEGPQLGPDGLYSDKPPPTENDSKEDHLEHLEALSKGGILKYRELKEKVDVLYLRNLLNLTSGNIAETARLSGLYRAHIYRMMQKYDIEPTNHKPAY